MIMGFFFYEQNQTMTKLMVLSGFQELCSFRIPLFLLVLFLYNVTLAGNVAVVTLVSLSQNLRHPMFFLLSHLSLSDTILTTTIVPIMLKVIIRVKLTMSLVACLAQLQFFGIALTSQCFILSIMSYDRYLAICHPLHYNTVMGPKLQLCLVTSCWFLSFAVPFVTIVFVSKLEFCGSNIINHFFCDFVCLLQVSCSDTSAVELENLVLATPTTLFPFIFIIVSYICIFSTILKIPSSEGRRKAFSTCSSHVTIVGVFFGTLVTLYVVPPNGYTLNGNKILCLLYTVVTPLFNPLIYSVQNKEIRLAFKKNVKDLIKVR